MIEQLLAANLLAASSRSHRFVTFAACSNRPLQQLLRSEVRGKLPQAMCVSLNHFAINGICSRDGSQECLDCQPELANLQTLNQILGLELRLRTKSVSDQLPNRLKGRWELEILFATTNKLNKLDCGLVCLLSEVGRCKQCKRCVNCRFIMMNDRR